MRGRRPTTMRDAVIARITEHMIDDERILFLTADLGAPALDTLRQRFSDRFVNVGIAEQNLLATATGAALEGGIVFAYGLAPFLSMRACEQIRNNLSLFGQLRPLNINLLALGAGLSYDVSGPTHHCVEDLSIIRTLPGIELLSPSDCVLAEAFVDHLVQKEGPAYLRLEGKPVPDLHRGETLPELSRGFRELEQGTEICFVGTGFPLHECARISSHLKAEGISIGLVDVFSLRPLNTDALFSALSAYRHIISVEESFLGCGGLDTLLISLYQERGETAPLTAFGVKDRYLFENGDREVLHRAAKMDRQSILSEVQRLGYTIPTASKKETTC